MFGLRYLTNVATLRLDEERCNGCKMCVIVCPHSVFAVENRKAIITDRDACMECGACALNCPEDALTVEAGVGCAAAVINGYTRGTEPVCDCGTKETTCCQ
jgi:NAD-dependent dihydropyrimidine dehydrogenase PreA subunit